MLIERTCLMRALDRTEDVVFKWEVYYGNYLTIYPHLNEAYSQGE